MLTTLQPLSLCARLPGRWETAAQTVKETRSTHTQELEMSLQVGLEPPEVLKTLSPLAQEGSSVLSSVAGTQRPG